MNVADDLYLGGFLVSDGILPAFTASEDPTLNSGVGPMGRIAFLNIVPLAAETANIAALQAQTAATALTLAAGTGVTAKAAPDGSGNTVYAFDVPRCVSLTSGGNLSAGHFTVTGYDQYGRKQTQTLVGPNGDTVNTTKAFASVLSVVPTTTSATTVSVGSANIYGLPYAITDAGYLVNVGWAGALARDTGTFVAAVTTTASATTGDTRGTYTPSSAANGTDRLVIGMHLTAAQCGPSASVASAIGVTPA